MISIQKHTKDEKGFSYWKPITLTLFEEFNKLKKGDVIRIVENLKTSQYIRVGEVI